MNKTNVVQFLKALGVRAPNTERKGWVRAPCIFAHWRHSKGVDRDPSFGINIESPKSNCYCFSCNTKGDLYGMLLELQMLNRQNPSGVDYDFATAMQLIATEGDAEELASELFGMLDSAGTEVMSPLTEFSEKYRESFPAAYDVLKGTVHAYLKRRNVSLDMAKYFDIRWDPELRRILFPIRGFNGKLYGLHGRAVDPKNEIRYFAYEYLGERNPNVWMNENHIDFDEPVVLTEGQFDLASIARVYDNVLASQTSALNLGKMRRIAAAKDIITFYDHGTGGDSARAYLDEFYRGKGISLHHVIPTPEEGDAGDMSEKQVYDYLVKYV